MTTLTSRNGTLEYGPGKPTMLINDQLYVINKPDSVIEPLSRGEIDYFMQLARWGHAVGTDMTAILLTHPEIDEVEVLPRLARAIHEELGSPVGLDTRNAEAIEAALAELQPYRSIIWTVTAEQPLLDTLLPIAKRYGAAVAGMPMGRFSGHVPMTAEERVAEAQVILEACEGIGIPREDVVIDAMCMPAGLLQANAYQVALQTIAILHDMGITTQLGIGNAGSNMPGPKTIGLAYLLGAMSWGLDSAFINPGIEGLIADVRAMDMLTERDPACRRYLKHWRAAQNAPQIIAPTN
ncbi:MAG: dihydropteroate synthase [Anaerolineaceae bacterium]|nr:dihydropteroate synthase [Anaerolineaceae bacterium]